MLRTILLLAACACVWDITAAGVLEIRCANVDEGRKVLIPSSAVNLQDACQLRVEVTPEQSGTYSFMLGVSALTEFIGREDIADSYMGQPKVIQLVNKSETFTDNNLYAIRSLMLDDIPLAGVRSALGSRYGTVYLLAALDNGTHFVDSVSIPAALQPPDESDVDLRPVVNEMDSWSKDFDGAVIVSALSPRIRVRVSVENLGSTPLAARTDPDALKVWVYVKRMMVPEHALGSPLVPLTEEIAMRKEHMPAPGDAVISLANVFGQTEPGSPAIPTGSPVPLTLTELAIADTVCGDALVIINVNPIGEMTDTNMTNNVVGIRVRSNCESTGGRCFMYGMPTPGRTLVALHHDYMTQPSNLIEYRAASGAIRPLRPYEMTATERVSLMHSVVLTHAVEAEVDRLEAIGSCDSADDAEPPTWSSSILGRLADSLANIRAPLLAVTTTATNESEQLDMAALVVETVGQLLQQPGSLRTILSTIIHSEGNMHSPGMEGTRPGREGGGYGGGNGYPGYGGDGNSYGSGYHGGGSGYYSGSSRDYSDSSGSYGDYSDYSGSSGDYSDYSGSSGDYSDYSSSSGDYSDYGSGSGDYSDYSGSSGDDSDYSGSSGDYSDSSDSSGDYSDYSGDSSGGFSDYSGSSGDYYSDYSGSSGDYYSDYSGSSGDYSDYSSGGPEVFPLPGKDGDAGAGPAPLNVRKVRSIFPGGMDVDGDMYQSYTTDMPNFGSGGYSDFYNEQQGGMDEEIGMRMMGPVSRLQQFMGRVASHVARGSYQTLNLPGCMSEEMNVNFRRFLKAIVWGTSVQEIPGYERVSSGFVDNLRRLIREFRAGKEIFLFGEGYPSALEESMGRWFEDQNVHPMMPVPDDFLESALQKVSNVSLNFTIQPWEQYNVEKKNMTMKLLGKVARALLERNRTAVLDKFVSAAVDLHRELASGGMALAGQPGEAPSRRDTCTRMVEMTVKKAPVGMEAPMVVKRDGDIFTVCQSPLTHEFLWRKAIACDCGGPPIQAR